MIRRYEVAIYTDHGIFKSKHAEIAQARTAYEWAIRAAPQHDVVLSEKLRGMTKVRSHSHFDDSYTGI